MKSNLKLTALLIHLLIFLVTTIIVWQTREPGVMPHEVIMWYGGYGLFLWQLFPFGTSVQWIIYCAAIVTLLAITVQIIGKENAILYCILWNIILTFLYLFPFAVSGFGQYIGP